ncbi:MAG: hypothetical protein GX956_08590 [Firmicutes bacterium]|nr:hypothetical protein [Bacillota bacterium]
MSTSSLDKFLVVLALLCALLALDCGNLVLASEIPRVEQIILILWHGLELEQIGEISLSEPAVWGLLNTRGGGGEPISAAYLSLGAGARVVGWGTTATFSQKQAAQALFQFNTGQVSSSIVQPHIAQILQAQQVNYTVVIGALGSAFQEAGLPLRTLGNSDGDEEARWAAVVGMDSLGRVFAGDVGEGQLIKDDHYPFGVRSDYSRLHNQILQAQEPLVIVDLGDPYRYDRYQGQLLRDQRDILRQKVFQDALNFLQEVAKARKTHTALVVVTPYPGAQGAEHSLWLAPVFALGLGEGLFVSGTTRWPGLITNLDLAPTILELLKITHNQPFIGRPATILPASNNPQAQVQKLGEQISTIATKRAPVLRVVISAQIILYSCVLIVLIIPHPLPRQLLRLLERVLILFLLLPLLLLVWSGPFWLVAVVLSGVLLLGIIYPHPLPKVGLISLATSLAIALDVVWGGWLIRFSYLGYDPIGGARFYGLGNEFMGIFVGATVLAWAILCQQAQLNSRERSFGGFFIFLLAVLIIGAPALGTNVGGAICGVFAFGYTWLSFRKRGFSWKDILVLILSLVLVLGLLIFVDQGNPSKKQSHIGQTVHLFKRDGFSALWLIIVRKLAMNLKLLRYSMWSKALLVALLVMGASFIWPSKFIFWLRKTYPLIAKGIGGVVIGALAAFIFNDSGVVAAATCLYFASTTLLLLALELKHNLHAS